MFIPVLARRAIGAVGSILYPPLCLVCSGAPGPNGAPVCAGCHAAMRRLAPGDPLVAEASHRLTTSGLIEGLSAAYAFEKRGPLQSALHLLKYSGMHSLGVWLGRELGGAIRSDPAFAGADVLVPVPLHGARLRERGYNQSERICAGIALATGLSVAAGALVRTRNTRSQTELTHREREENVHAAFALRKGRGGREVRGRVVILVDDVITTGSTLVSCAAALRDGGARSVLAAAVAVAEHAA